MMVTFPDWLRRRKVRKMACDFPMKNIVANYRRFRNYFKCPKSISFLYCIYKRDIEIDEGGRERGRESKRERENTFWLYVRCESPWERGVQSAVVLVLIQEWILLLTLFIGLLTCPPCSDLGSLIYNWTGGFQWPYLLVFQHSYTLTYALFTKVSSVVLCLCLSIHPFHQTLELVQNSTLQSLMPPLTPGVFPFLVKVRCWIWSLAFGIFQIPQSTSPQVKCFATMSSLQEALCLTSWKEHMWTLILSERVSGICGISNVFGFSGPWMISNTECFCWNRNHFQVTTQQSLSWSRGWHRPQRWLTAWISLWDLPHPWCGLTGILIIECVEFMQNFLPSVLPHARPGSSTRNWARSW